MKKIGILFAMIIMFVLFALSANALESTGQCGDNVYWNFDESTGELVISGEGDMWNYVSFPPDVDNGIKSVVIEDGVTSICTHAFYYCGTLTTVLIPDSVITINDSAFENCQNLVDLTIPEGVKSIGDSAFKNCKSLKSISIPNSVTDIGDSAFYGCSWISSAIIGNGVTDIPDSMFYLCYNLSIVTIPESVERIGDGAFYSCSVAEVHISDISAWCSILFEDNPLFNDAGLYLDGELLTELVISDGVISISKNAFNSCTSIKSVSIPGSVETIGSYAFDCCTNLKSITVDENNENYSSDEYGVLFNKDKTTLLQHPIGNSRAEYTIPDSVINIGDRAFYACKSLVNIEIPDGLIRIGDCAFSGSNLSSIKIPDSVTSIGDEAFYFCGGLKSITVDENNENYLSDKYGVLFNKNKTTLIQYPVGSVGAELIPYPLGNSQTTYKIPDSVTRIGDGAFSGCSNLSSITIPDSVTSIANGALPVSGDVYYLGTKSQWKEIGINLHNAFYKIHFLTDGTNHYFATVIKPACTETGVTQISCNCGYSYTINYSATGHNYNSNKVCVNCGYINCSCKCHKTGIANFFWKISNFFNKLFKVKKKQMCACGIMHY